MSNKQNQNKKPKPDPVYAISLVRKNGQWAQATYKIQGNKVVKAWVGNEDIQTITLGKIESLLVAQANKEPLPDGF